MSSKIVNYRPRAQHYTPVLGRDERGWKLVTVRLSDEAKAQVDAFVARAKTLAVINTDDDERAMIELLGDGTSLLGDMEAARQTVKRPFLEAQGLIDKTARYAVTELKDQVNRVKAEIGRYNGDKRRRAEAEALRLKQVSDSAMLASSRVEDPSRKAHLEAVAEDTRKEASEIQQEAVTEGIAVTLTWEIALLDWREVVNSNPQFLCEPPLNKPVVMMAIKAMKERGESITEDMFPGIKITPKTVVSSR